MNANFMPARILTYDELVTKFGEPVEKDTLLNHRFISDSHEFGISEKEFGLNIFVISEPNSDHTMTYFDNDKNIQGVIHGKYVELIDIGKCLRELLDA